jgi:hypothetical protein
MEKKSYQQRNPPKDSHVAKYYPGYEVLITERLLIKFPIESPIPLL